MEYRGDWKLLFFIFGLLLGQTLQSSVWEGPKDTIVEKGTYAQFSCKIEGDAQKEYTYWARIMPLDGTEILIYKTNDLTDFEFDSEKYNFTETAPLQSNIVVKDVAWVDAGTYLCAPLLNPYNKKTARLVVVGEPSISIPESMAAGREATFVCEFTYAGGNSMDENSLKPTLTAEIGDTQPDFTVTETPETSTGIMHTMKSEYKLTMKPEHDGKDFTCIASIASSPPYEIVSSGTIFLDIPVTNVKIDPEREVYYPGEEVNCSADGYPHPEFTWIPVVSNSKDSFNSSVLTITPDMAGENQWKCIATNVIDGSEYSTDKIVSFSVEELLTGESRSNGAVVALAVVIPLILIALIVIILMFFWRKRKQSHSAGKAPAKDPEKTGPLSQNTDPLLNKKLAMDDDSPPEGGPFLPQPAPGLRMDEPSNRASIPSQRLTVNDDDYTLGFSGAKDDAETATRHTKTPSPVGEKSPPQTSDPPLDKTSPPTDNSPPAGEPLLPKAGIPTDDPDKRTSVQSADVADVARRALTPSPVDEKSPPFPPNWGSNRAEPVTMHTDTEV